MDSGSLSYKNRKQTIYVFNQGNNNQSRPSMQFPSSEMISMTRIEQ